jgi:isopentenyl phosphate kinase
MSEKPRIGEISLFKSDSGTRIVIISSMAPDLVNDLDPDELAIDLDVDGVVLTSGELVFDE